MKNQDLNRRDMKVNRPAGCISMYLRFWNQCRLQIMKSKTVRGKDGKNCVEVLYIMIFKMEFYCTLHPLFGFTKAFDVISEA